MHLLATTSTNLDEIVEAVDLGQPPGDIVILSFADSDLGGLAAAWEAERAVLPSVRLAHLNELRHPMSVDLWIDKAGIHARVIVVRLLGGLDWWKYGIERLSALASEHGIVLAVLPGEDRDDPRLAEASTLPAPELAVLLGFFREGGRENLRALLRRLARHAGRELETHEPKAVPRFAGYLPDEGAVDLDRLAELVSAPRRGGGNVVPIVFYRAALLAADTAPVDALYAALLARGLVPAPIVVPSLKDAAAAAFLREAFARLDPVLIVTMTAFAAGGGDGALTPLDEPGVPVLQAICATTKRAAWRDSPRGLGAADLAMHVVLPELDGRILAGAIAFKEPRPVHDALAFAALVNRPEPDRIEMVADRIAALVRLRSLPRGERGIAVLMPDYPGAPGRTGYAVGLDVPASVIALLDDLKSAGYGVSGVPATPRGLLDALAAADEAVLAVAQYEKLLARVPDTAVAQLRAAWGDAVDDPDCRSGAFRFRAKKFGKVWAALPPDRGRAAERRADYHDPALPPRHALVAFGLWLQHVAKADALVHMGAHGTLEWLPGKAVALTAACFPEIVTGPLPAIYPFIVSNPGEAAQAKRRIAAVTIGHLPPPLVSGGLTGDARELERLIDEYAQADGLDRRRRERLARLIVETAQRTGLMREAGVEPPPYPPPQAGEGREGVLRRIDAWLCDLKDLAIKDGLHVYGRTTSNIDDPQWRASAAAERDALIAALDGRRVAPGPAGAPSRGRRDVLPTGRNLYTADPRTLPTPTSMDLGRLAADELLRAHLQAHGELPRAVVIDLWGSATLRTGGEEIAQGFALMGCRPIWEAATGRITGVEVLPTASFGRARVDVTWRISGLFRDLFPAQIALMDAAIQAVAARDEDADENPLAAALRSINGGNGAGRLDRIFGTAAGAYGAGVEDLFGPSADANALGAAYLAAASHAYGGAAGEGSAAPGAFATRIADADMLVHPGDDPGRDLLEGAEDAAFVGGFAAAAKMLGHTVDLVMLDVTDPQRPRARTLSAALARIVRGRAIDPRFIAGQMRHGPRGAAELAETVDRLFAFAQSTDAVASELFDLLHDAYVADPAVRAFLLRENPQAANVIADRLDAAQRRGFWHPRRNDLAASLAALRFLPSPPCGGGEGGGSGGGVMASRLVRNLPTPTPDLSPQGRGERRRGACPGLSAPMQTGDGLLVRLLPVGTISLAAFAGLCAAARQHGNGIVEITARGSIQVRGLSAASAHLFAARVGALGIAADDGVPILTNPLAGLAADEMLDAGALAGDLRRALPMQALRSRLDAKVSIVMDGGGSPDLDALAADLRFRALGAGHIGVSLGGDASNATPLGSIAVCNAVEVANRLLEIIAARGPTARVNAILADEGVAIFHAAVADLLVGDAPEQVRCRRGEAIRQFRLRDGMSACAIGLPFGHAAASSLAQLIDAAAAAGAAGVRTAPQRVLMAIGHADNSCSGFVGAAEKLGFVVRADDPRRSVIACAGAPICASGHIAARAIAPVIAETAARYNGDSLSIHVSGCAKGCAHPAPAALTIVGTADGCALIANGSARQTPFAVVRADELQAAIGRYACDSTGEPRHA